MLDEGDIIQIAISGPLSSGKTTLFGALSKQFPSARHVAEVAWAAKVAAADFDWGSEAGRGYLRWTQAIAENIARAQSRLSILDGSLSDVAAYDRVYAMRPPAASIYRPYDLTLLCMPEGVEIEDNGVRDMSGDLRIKMMELLLEEAERRSARVLQLTGPHEERVARAVSAIDALTQGPEVPLAGIVLICDAGIGLLRRGNRDFWELPGGHLEMGETPAAAARREAYEELGLECGELLKIAEANFVEEGRRYRYHYFAPLGWIGQPAPREEKFAEFAFVNLAALRDQKVAASPALGKFLVEFSPHV